MVATLRHAAVVKSLRDVAEHSSRWAVLSASYRMLVLLDRWLDGEDTQIMAVALVEIGQTLDSVVGASAEIAESAAVVRAVRDAVAAARFEHGGRESITEALLQWSERCWRRLELDMALDVAHTALECAPRDSALLAHAHLECALIHRVSGNFSEADRQYTACAEVGEVAGSVEWVFRGRLGLTKVMCARGNLPLAEERIRELVTWAIALGMNDLERRSRHDLGTLLGLRGRLDEALIELETALRVPSVIDEERLIDDIGYTHVLMGNFALARDLYTQVAESARDSWNSSVARVSLLEIHAALGDRDGLEAGRRRLEAESLPTLLEIDFRIGLGQAYLTLGDIDAAQPAMEAAAALAQQSGMGQFLIRAEQALEGLERARRRAAMQSDAGARAPFASEQGAGESNKIVGARE